MCGSIPYIGSKISLITTSDIRYEGILYTLKSEESTIAVQNVRSFGTEGRRTPEVPRSNEIYDFIIFRGKDLKDLTVLQEAPERLSPCQVPDYADSYGGAFQNHSMFPDAGGFPGAAAPMGAFQRPGGIGNTAARPFSPVAGGLPFSSYQAVPYPDNGFGRPADRGFGGLHCRPSYPCVEQQEPPPQSPAPGSRSLFDENSGVASSRATSEEVLGAASRSLDSKDRNGEARDQKARGRGKGVTQKKPFFEVIRNHEKAKEAILKSMRSQNSALLGSAELRALSEVNPAVYHFYLDFENHCCPHVVQSDEQQWEMLCKALKKHFEKEVGLGGQKAPQRPNSTLGDFITIQESGKKSSKGRGGRGRGGRGEKPDGSGPVGCGPVEEPVQSGSSWNCPRCTLSNDTILVECAACGTSKQQAALWAEFPPLGQV